MPIVETDKPDTRIPAARTVLVAGASVAAALTTAVAVPSSVASESPADGGPATGVVGSQLNSTLERQVSDLPLLSAQWQTASGTPKRTAAAASNSTGHYSIPASIVMCESGGNYRAVNTSTGAGGAYQILPSTWASYGGTGLPQDAPPPSRTRSRPRSTPPTVAALGRAS